MSISFMHKPVKIMLLASMVVLTGCNKAPDCQFQGAGDTAPSAGCLVTYRGALLLVETAGAKFGPPAGSVDEGESAQCAAERETWEETGVPVVARRLAHRFNNDFHLYWCDPVEQPPEVAIHRPLEVASANFYQPDDFFDLRWRFKDQATLIYRLMQQK